MTRAALGCRAHSGWAALVAVASLDGELAVIERRRIELAHPSVEGFPQPYHAAEGLTLTRAAELVNTCIRAANDTAKEALARAVDDLRGRGFQVKVCGILAGSGRPLPAFDKILASHALLHTAEGEMFRDALRHGAACNKLSVAAIRERAAWEDAALALGAAAATLEAKVAGMGRGLGPPWRQDQKLATLAAWAALGPGIGRH